MKKLLGKHAAPTLSRRSLVSGMLAGGAVIAVPALLRRADAATAPIRIGVPLTLTGTYAVLGAQITRTCNLFKKILAEKGGPSVEFLYEDTQGNPANCVRKAQELVERHGIKLIMGVPVSSEARAILPKLAEWGALFLSHGNGDGKLTTAELLVPNFFRANTSAPMGARTLALYLKDSEHKSFFALGSDYAWGQSSVAAFEKQLERIGRKLDGKVFTPTGNKDYSTYITQIVQSGAKALYVALQGDEARAFYSQAAQYGLPKRVQLMTEIVAQEDIKTLGRNAAGLIGSSRYAYTYDIPENQAFVKRFTKEYGEFPDWTDGEMYQALEILFAGIKKAGSTDTKALIRALEGLKITSVKGPVVMRECDHQGVNQGFMVRVVETPDRKTAMPQIVRIYPGELVTPDCKTDTYSN